MKDLLKSVMMMVYSTLTPSLSTSGAAASVIRDMCEVLGRGGDTCKSCQMILLHTYNVMASHLPPASIGNPGSFPHRQYVVLWWFVEVQ